MRTAFPQTSCSTGASLATSITFGVQVVLTACVVATVSIRVPPMAREDRSLRLVLAWGRHSHFERGPPSEVQGLTDCATLLTHLSRRHTSTFRDEMYPSVHTFMRRS